MGPEDEQLEAVRPCLERPRHVRRDADRVHGADLDDVVVESHPAAARQHDVDFLDRKSTRLNSSHSQISYAVFCLKKKKKTQKDIHDERTQHQIHRLTKKNKRRRTPRSTCLYTRATHE